MVTKRPRAEAEVEFVEAAEKHEPATKKDLPIRDVTRNEPAWKRRNREPKSTGTQFRFSKSQLELLQMAKADQEKSIQKILEAIVWPVLEEQYGATEKDAPT